MTETPFVHLHLHSQYSLLQGAIKIKDLVARAKELGFKSLGISDSHALFGGIDFYFACKDAGIKPILGVEAYFAPEGRAVFLQADSLRALQSQGKRLYPIVLICKSLNGYRNLCQILTKASLEGSVGWKKGADPIPTVDPDLLSRHSEDLVVLSGGLKGEVTYNLLQGNDTRAEESALWFQRVFGKNFYLELQDTGLPEQEQANALLYSFGKRLGIESVVTCECHYLNQEDSSAHEVLQCIEQGRNLEIDRPKSLVPSEFYLKPGAVVWERMAQYADALNNTVRVADECNIQFQFKDAEGKAIYHLPVFRPEGVSKEDTQFDVVEFFRQESRNGLKRRLESAAFVKKRAKSENPTAFDPPYWERLEEELSMIEKTGFSSYFLIVADFIQWAKKNGIPVGPGRGSGAGSLVAYSLQITDIDPIEFKLLFERFINPERVSMPDFDVDFCQDRRGEVIEYVVRKYGSDNVCQIITFGKLQARAVIKDVARVFGLSFAEADQLTKLLPDELNIKISDAIQQEKAIQDRIEQDPKTRTVFEYARKLEGLYRNAGVHAAGVIITENPVVQYCPLYKGKEGEVVTQFDKDFSEKIGLVKFDFLGLKTLTVIDTAVKMVHKTAAPGSPESLLCVEDFPLDDTKVFQLISSGDTDGVFQVESSGMKDLCMRLIPNSVEDVTAINALYRPGPLGSGMVDDFIDRKHGRKPMAYELPHLAEILKETYGVILYQEQVMQIARELAGYSLGQADMLRRAMGKKKPEEMAKHKDLFVKGAMERSIPQEKAETVFDLMAKFAEYGFNKSHSAAYAMITYQTAYLKCYFPVEFMAALMTTEMDKTEKIAKYVSDARGHQIAVLPPDVNKSERKFSVDIGEKKSIRFALEAIKGVGGAAVDVILEARQEKGPFKSVLDFCKRVSTRKVNKKVLESLILAGALDSIAEVHRASLFSSVDALIDVASGDQEEKALGQTSLFDSFQEDQIRLMTPTEAIFKPTEEWSFSRKLALEKQIVGFYLSGHPMEVWQKICDTWLGANTQSLKSMKTSGSAGANGGGGFQGGRPEGGGPPRRREARVGGVLTEIKEIQSKRGKMAIVGLEDLYGKMEIVFFSDSYSQLHEPIKKAIAEAEPVVIEGDLDAREETVKIIAKGLESIQAAQKGDVQQVVLKLNPEEVTVDQLRALRGKILANRGKCTILIEFVSPRFRMRMPLSTQYRVAPTPNWIFEVNHLLGGKPVVELRSGR